MNEQTLGESSLAVAKEQVSLKASSLLLGELEHPNKMPFSGILTWFDAPSDSAPNGSRGRKVVIPSSVGVPALGSLQGMAVNFRPDGWNGHSPTDKIGVITNAYTGSPDADGAIPVHVEGYIYAHDFEDVAVDIKLNQASLGFSYETAKTQIQAGIYGGEEVAMVTDVGYFTGAAILLKATAAYKNTSLAASEDGKEELQAMGEDQVKSILEAISALRDYVDTKFSVMQDRQWFDEMLQDSYQRMSQADDAVSDALEEAAEAAGVELDPEGGEVAVSAAEQTEQVEQETVETPEAVEAPVETTESVETVETEVQAAEQATDIDALRADLQAARDELASVTAELETVRTELTASQAETTAISAAARKSIPYSGTLISKFGAKEEDSDATIMASIESSELSIEDRIAAKLELRSKRLKQQD